MKKWILLLSLPAMAFLAQAQNYIPKVTTYTTKDGLSSNQVYAIHKDVRGFLWIGTQNGLDCFDGRSFVHFSKTTHPQMSIDRVQSIAEDQEGYLWLLEKNETFEFNYASPELIFYNIHTHEWLTFEERFGNEKPFEISNITFMEQQADGSIFFYDQKHFKGFLYAGQVFTSFPLPQLSRVSDFAIQKDGHFLMEGTLEFLGNRRIFLINRKGEVINKCSADLPITIQNQDRKYQLQLSSTDLLVGGKNLDAYQLLNSDWKESSTTSEAMLIDQTAWNEEQALLWLKSNTQIFVTKRNGDIVYQREDKFDWNDLPILFDGTTTWYGNQQNGLVKVTLQPNYFKSYQSDSEGFNNSSRGIYADESGNIWISTIKGSLFRGAGQKTFKEITQDEIYTTYIKDRSNYLWSFKANGLSKYDLSSGQQELVPCSWQGAANTWAMYEADDGKLWFYGHYGYHYIFDPETQEYSNHLQLPLDNGTAFNVYDIQKRDAQSVWLCTNQGLYIVDKQGNYLAHYSQLRQEKFHLPAMNFHHMYQDRAGTIWLASGDNGLLELKRNKDELQIVNHYTSANGLSCNILHSVYEDAHEYLWISSNEGLMQLDKRTGKVVTYTTEEGLLHNEFNRISHFQADDGTLYFGGLTGVIAFHPKHFSKIRNETNQAPLVVTNYQQYSSEKEQFEDLSDQLLQTNTIELQAYDRFFKLSLALLNYEDGASYQYRIKGLYDWQSRSFEKERELNISGLPYGQHILEIKAQNNRQQKAANTLSFTIQVKRPFYWQWWFITLAVVLTGAFFFLLAKWRTRQMIALQETEQLKMLDKMKSRFFTNIAHELRTPLTLIGLPLEHLLRNIENFSVQEIRDYLLSAYQHRQDLNQKVNEILDLSKLESGKLLVIDEALALNDFLEKTVEVFKTSAVAKGIELRYSSFVSDKLIVRTDQAKLQMIINNLLSNALKFTPEKGMITVHANWQKDTGFSFKVQDNGRGIPTADLPLVFERYFQSGQNFSFEKHTKEPQLEGGSGIGLAVCKEMVELLGGQIEAQSEPGSGSTFTFSLPMKLTEEAIGKAPVRDFDRSMPPVKSTLKKEIVFEAGKARILIVEDHPQLRQYLCDILAPEYNIYVASNGEEALERLGTDQIDLILSDVMMPVMDGFTFLEKVKKEDQYCSIPFILLTARTTIKDKLNGLRIGVDAYMTKPFAVEELLLRVKHLLANVKNRTEEFALVEEAPSMVLAPVKTKPELAPVLEAPIVKEDLDWLEQLEQIAQREIKSTNYNVEDLAKELLMSRRQLFRKIKKITGLTPKKYLNAIRLQKARSVLETEEVLTLTEICYAVGFENTTHFANLFETEFGFRPHGLLKK